MSNSVRNNKTMKPVICFICQTKCFFYYSNINSLKSKHTKRSIVEFIRIFVDDPSKFDENEFSLSSDKDDDYICYECMDKINVYDLAKSTAERIQAEMHKLLNQSKRKSTEVPPFFVGSELEQDSWNELEEEENDSSASSYGFDEDLLRPVKESQFRCYICSVDLRTTERFAEHQCLHENVPEMQCVYCGNSFKSKSGLWVHVTKHIKNELGEADYQCEYCGRTFITFQSLRSHLHTHVDCRTMECDICSFRCSTKAKLKKHMISHMKTKDFACSICGRKFAHRGNVKPHELTHQGITDKIHQCSFCGVAFSRKYKLREHLVKHHGIIQPHEDASDISASNSTEFR